MRQGTTEQACHRIQQAKLNGSITQGSIWQTASIVSHYACKQLGSNATEVLNSDMKQKRLSAVFTLIS